jgi:hypothetical protein
METPDVDLDKECRNCIHRKTGSICENAHSPHFQRRVSSEDTCDYFEVSKAQAHYVRALSTAFIMLNEKSLNDKEESLRGVVDNYDAAIAAGLPAEDEAGARLGIAAAYAPVVAHRLQTSRDMSELESEDAHRVLSEMRKAGEMETKYDVDNLSSNWYQLSNVDLLLDLKAAVIARDESVEASERFVREQLEPLDHIIPTPLPRTFLRLGRYLARQGKYGVAAECFQNVLESMSRKESGFIAGADKIKQEARSPLEQVSEDQHQTQGRKDTAGAQELSSGNPPKSGGCFVATAVYGSNLSSEVVRLSIFRDTVLLRSQVGRSFVKFYNRVSPPLAEFIASREPLRVLTRELLLKPILRLLERLPWEDQETR